MTGPRILLVVGGGIAAYKACELVRVIRKFGGEATCVVTESGTRFVTPLALAALSERPVYTSLFDLRNEVEMGHIQLSRDADLVVVCPATADLLAKMAMGIADDLATTLLLATNKPVMAVPAMNVRMWQHAATVRNVHVLREAGVDVMEPDEGMMACGEFGPGRLPDPEAIWQRIAWAVGRGAVDIAPLPQAGERDAGGPDAFDGEDSDDLGGLSPAMLSRRLDTAHQTISAAPPVVTQKGAARAAPSTDPGALHHLLDRIAGGADDILDGQPGFERAPAHRPLYGRHVLVTAGPTWEPIDPVRYIANRSSGKQGFAIAAAAAAAGARVTLVAGPVHLETPPGVDRVDVESGLEMFAAVKAALPADIAVMVAAVADWRTASIATDKMKKQGGEAPALELTQNPDILATIAQGPERPALVVGFAAETRDVIAYAQEKRLRKGADWIVANDVSGDVMGGDANTVHVITGDGVVSLPEMSKGEVARALVERMADALAR